MQQTQRCFCSCWFQFNLSETQADLTWASWWVVLISVADVMILSCQSIGSSQHLNPYRNPAIWCCTNCRNLSMFLYCARCLLLIASRRNVIGGRRLLVAARDISRDSDYHGPLVSNKYKRMCSFNLFYMLRCFALAQSSVIVSFRSLAIASCYPGTSTPSPQVINSIQIHLIIVCCF